MIFTSTTGLQIKAFNNDETFKSACMKTAQLASSNLLKLRTAGQNRIAALLAFSDVNEYEYTLGIPMALALTSDYIAASLGARSGTGWLIRLLEAIQPGADLSYVFPQYLAWFLDDNIHGVIRFAQLHGTGSSIRAVATALRAGTTAGLYPAPHLTEGDNDIAHWADLSRLEHVIARSTTSGLESLDIAACVPERSAAKYTIDSLAAGIAERIALLAKKLLLDGQRTAERIKLRFLASESPEELSSATLSPARFTYVDMISGNVASAELWTRISFLMYKTQELSSMLPDEPFSIEFHAEKLLELVRDSKPRR